MSKRIFSCFVFLLFATLAVQAQSRRQWLELGDQAYNQANYKLALSCYMHVIQNSTSGDRDVPIPYECRAYTPNKKTIDTAALYKAAKMDSVPNVIPTPIDPRTLYTTHRIAECFRELHDYENAEAWYAQASKYEHEKFPDALYWYGVSLMNNGKYDDAVAVLEKYSAKYDPQSPQARKANRAIGGSMFAQDTSSYKKEVIVEELDSIINAGTATFAAAFYGDPNLLLFTSARQGNVSTDDLLRQGLEAYSTDLYMAEKSGGKWGKPQAITTDAGNMNTPMNEGSAMVSFGREHLFFTRWSADGKECSIFMSRNVGEKWLAPIKLNNNVNVAGTKSMHPFFSNDGTTLYFCSDRPGGMGGIDIWMVKLDEEGNASQAVNMGSVINTPENEITPFYHFTTSTLFYSSNGLGGFGGFDIVKSAFNAEDSTWSVPKNLESPFNSPRDDAYFSMDRIQQHGYFSSDRKRCEECGPAGGYCYRAYSYTNEPLVFMLKGYVYNSETNEPISNALLTFKDIRGEIETFYIITDSTGYYETALSMNQELYIKAQKNKYFGDATNISTVGETDSKVFEHDFFLTPIPAGEIVIPGIEYDFDRATLRPESQKILDDLAAFLELNNNLSVEISSHTDSRGSDKYNLKLSQARAKSCMDYLIAKGIAVDRLQATGYGETKPLITDAEINKLPTKDEQEAAHQKNRRTAFRPIKEGAIMEKWEGNLPPRN